ncbi:Nicotinamidase-related amidase [Nitrosomonas cryotolerans]|uniref:Nicotinamidase-related amidase n=1 Tax=Nitrosomonas cryotolerans ATCC 49181 TaxID=1131553 RepID=A0A1N6F8K8_9PROT|nr:cysteine hydrolase family protein [Nitrosomonas cryotolerans]SFP99564.1 Nicotinamidase-related amidase [Nitrosomonas cryotolerans]SIN91590.1 Nicotinamidase-related amidase [Nitrosomonas cryotolerans ATCC 49181]
MTKTALLLIDFQNDYFSSYDGAKYALSGTEEAANQGAKLLAAFRAKGLPIVHVRHEFPTNDAPFFLPGSEGAAIHTSVAASSDEPVVLKHQINSFHDTNLKAILDKQGIENVVIAGAMTHMCVDAVTRAAKDFGYNCAIAHDACATLDLEFNGVKVPAEHVHAVIMAALNFAYANVVSVDELIEGLA